MDAVGARVGGTVGARVGAAVGAAVPTQGVAVLGTLVGTGVAESGVAPPGVGIALAVRTGASVAVAVGADAMLPSQPICAANAPTTASNTQTAAIPATAMIIYEVVLYIRVAPPGGRAGAVADTGVNVGLGGCCGCVAPPSVAPHRAQNLAFARFIIPHFGQGMVAIGSPLVKRNA